MDKVLSFILILSLVALGQSDWSKLTWVKVVDLSGRGSKKSSPLVFAQAQYYSAAFDTPGECYYSITLKPVEYPKNALDLISITSGSGPNNDYTFLYNIKAGKRYYVEVITGSANSCPWRLIIYRSNR